MPLITRGATQSMPLLRQPVLVLNVTDLIDEIQLLFMLAVRKVEPKDVNSAKEELLLS